MVASELDNLEPRIADLVQIWIVLEALTVSLDRIGTYERYQGATAAQHALSEYLDPHMFMRIANARGRIVQLLENEHADLGLILDELATNQQLIGAWDGPKL